MMKTVRVHGNMKQITRFFFINALYKKYPHNLINKYIILINKKVNISKIYLNYKIV